MSAVVSCFCGAVYECDDDLGVCPNCHEPSALPSISTREAREMSRDVDLMTRFPVLADEDSSR